MTRPAIDARLMLSVTVQAPPHLDLDFPGNARHAGNVSMTGTACESSAYMHHVRKIDVVRHPVDPDPGDRFFVVPVHHELLYFRFVPRDEQMAGPAVRHRGDTGDGRLRGVSVAKEARDAVVSGMDFVTEGDRLR